MLKQVGFVFLWTHCIWNYCINKSGRQHIINDILYQ